MKRFVWVWLASACVVNGQGYGPGTTTTPPPQQQGQGVQGAQGAQGQESLPRGYVKDADGRMVYNPSVALPEDERYYTEPTYSTAPVDPWAGVVGDQPLRWPEAAADHWRATSTEADCTALRDHCLVRETWFFVRPSDIERHAKYPSAQVTAAVGVFGPTGPARPWNARSQVHGENLIAYRTVPATKANLIPGSLVIGLSRERGIPRSGIAALETAWVFGPLESVDYDLGVYRIKDFGDTLALEGARVAVLQYREGGRVEIVGNRRRDQLAVSARDVFLPAAP